MESKVLCSTFPNIQDAIHVCFMNNACEGLLYAEFCLFWYKIKKYFMLHHCFFFWGNMH